MFIESEIKLYAYKRCAAAIENAINAMSENHKDYSLNESAQDIIDKFGLETVQYVLANTLQNKNEDGRISSKNKEWAKEFDIFKEKNECFLIKRVNSELLNQFVNVVINYTIDKEVARMIDVGEMMATPGNKEEVYKMMSRHEMEMYLMGICPGIDEKEAKEQAYSLWKTLYTPYLKVGDKLICMPAGEENETEFCIRAIVLKVTPQANDIIPFVTISRALKFGAVKMSDLTLPENKILEYYKHFNFKTIERKKQPER